MSQTFGKMGTRTSDLKLQLCDVNNINSITSMVTLSDDISALVEKPKS